MTILIMNIAERIKPTTSKLLNVVEIDLKDELDERLEAAFIKYSDVVNSTSTEREFSDAIQTYVFKSPANHETIQTAILYLLLTDPSQSIKCYQNIVTTSRDSWYIITFTLNKIILELWPKLKYIAKKQILWLMNEYARDRINGGDSLMLNLLRQCAGGDTSDDNIYLIKTILEILKNNMKWMFSHSCVITHALYKFLRCILDHSNSNFHQLRESEVLFCINLMKEKWDICKTIGRDLIRCLQAINTVPGIKEFWNEMLTNPTLINPTFTGIRELMLVRTSKRFHISRLTPAVENKVQFIINKVKFGNQRRYQDWLIGNKSPEADSLRSDIIRYITVVIHPSNELLGSDVVPRWALIGWLIHSSTSPIHMCHSRIALLFDWMIFDPAQDSIMIIEPGILVMQHSVKGLPEVTCSLLELLCKLMNDNYFPIQGDARKPIFASLMAVVEKKVTGSLAPLLTNPKLGKDLRQNLSLNFAPFCKTEVDVLRERRAKQADHATFTPISPNEGSATPRANSPLQAAAGTLNKSPSTVKPAEIRPSAAASTPVGQTTENCSDRPVIQAAAPSLDAVAKPTELPDSNPPMAKKSQVSDKQSTKKSISSEKPLTLKKGQISEKSLTLKKGQVSEKTVTAKKGVALEKNSTTKKIAASEKTLTTKKSQVSEKISKLKKKNQVLEKSLRKKKSNVTGKTKKSNVNVVNGIGNISNKKLDNRVPFEVPCKPTLIPFAEPLKALLAPTRKLLINLKNAKSIVSKTAMMEDILIDYISDDGYHQRVKQLALCLCCALQRDVLSVFPRIITPKSLANSICNPLFLFFKILTDPTIDKSDQVKISLLAFTMNKVMKKVGYLFLYYIKITNKGESSSKMAAYKDYVGSQRATILFRSITRDLNSCSQCENRMFAFLLPDIYQGFPKYSNSNIKLIHLICANNDMRQQQELICEILRGHIIMFTKKDKFLNICRNSLNWETIEQMFFWQLVEAHNVPFHFVEPLIPTIVYRDNAEACIGIQLIVKRESPSLDLVRTLLKRQIRDNDLFTVCILNYWSKEDGELLAEFVQQLLMRPNSSKGKRKIDHRDQPKVYTKDSQILKDNVELVLSNLDQMRKTCQNISFFEFEAVQQSLIGVQLSCNDHITLRYADLLALAVDDDPIDLPARVLRSVPARRASKVSHNNNNFPVATSNRHTAKPKRSHPTNSDLSSEADDSGSEINTSSLNKKSRRITDDD